MLRFIYGPTKCKI